MPDKTCKGAIRIAQLPWLATRSQHQDRHKTVVKDHGSAPFKRVTVFHQNRADAIVGQILSETLTGYDSGTEY